ncbi:hypothetical protein CSA37_09635 [Candidatus Fermentibacteria bacterium]|nr:MAG: hypothetical protein CSA37_09635 [Candidatus Fermentibacteria bacterium]
MPWFVSTCLLLLPALNGIVPVDIEIDNNGRLWVLSALEPAVYRITMSGERNRFEVEDSGPLSGLALSPGGRWAVSSRNSGKITVFNSDDLVIEELVVGTPGDLVFTGMDIWVVNISTGDIVSPWSGVIARGIAGADSRLCAGKGGEVLVSGSSGVFKLSSGQAPVSIAQSGSACFAGESVMVEGNAILSASSSGNMVIRWGPDIYEVLE